jgi:hypothetical protein
MDKGNQRVRPVSFDIRIRHETGSNPSIRYSVALDKRGESTLLPGRGRLRSQSQVIVGCCVIPFCEGKKTTRSFRAALFPVEAMNAPKLRMNLWHVATHHNVPAAPKIPHRSILGQRDLTFTGHHH